MLQQTRVEAVKDYYTRFLKELPTVEALAHCDDERLHKLWEGLGYYSRVRNLQKAAKVIMIQYGGVFPEDYDAIRSLPGVGDYTAGAICSICFDLPTPAVDGNVLRLMARLENSMEPIDRPQRKQDVRQALSQVYPSNAGDFTQALMELGATLCGPNRPPACDGCPCAGFCRGYAAGTAVGLPVKTPKRRRTEEELTVWILRCGERYALSRRPKTGLLAGLWEFPNTPGELDTAPALEYLETMGLHPTEVHSVLRKKHIFTHIQWNMTGYYVTVSGETGDYQWYTAEEIETQAALPTAFRQFWQDACRVFPR